VVQVLQNFNSFSIHSLLYITPQEEVNRGSVRISWGHGMGPSLPIHLTACHTYSMAYTEMQNVNDKQYHSALMPVCCITLPNTSKFDMFCHSLLLSPMLHIVWVTQHVFFKPWCSFLAIYMWNVQKTVFLVWILYSSVPSSLVVL
jgi:hypothetical protein